MKRLLLLAITTMVFLAIPSFCAAQKCRAVTGESLMVFTSPHDAYRWVKITSTDKETGDNYLNRLNDTGHMGGLEIGREVYTIDKMDFTLYSANDFPMYQLADFNTKKPIGWIFGWDLKDNLKPCK